MGFRKSLVVTAVAMAFMLPVAGHAYEANYVAANADGCKVYASDYNLNTGYTARYTGACQDGKATGKGRLEWLVVNHEGTTVSSAWDGYFQNGVYVGDKPLPRATIEQSLHGYIVHLSAVKSGDVIVIAPDDTYGKFQLCGSDELGISLNGTVTVTDDEAVKKAIAEAAESLHALCPAMIRDSAHVNVYATPFKVNEKGQLTPDPAAGASVNWKTMALDIYSNDASDAVRSKAQIDALKAKHADLHKQFAEFTKRNGIVAWVTVKQLEENPFKYEGKTIGTVVTLDHMLTRDTALVTGRSDEGGSVQIHGVTPDFPDHSHGVMLAAKVGQREAAAGGQPAAVQYTALIRADSATCGKPDCEDWLEEAGRIVWGENYTPAQ